MKIGVVSDAHGNPLGLQQCLTHFSNEGVERIFFLGDAIGYMPAWNEVLTMLSTSQAICIMGNHEAMLLDILPITSQRESVYKIKHNKPQLLPEEIRRISQWPQYIVKNFNNKQMLFVHGSPRETLTGYVYPNSDVSYFADLPYDVIFMGNSHYPFVRCINDKLIINAGSCGLPRDQGNLASCVIYDACKNGCDIIRLPFDISKIISKYEHQIDNSVLRCLLRKATGPVVGKIF